MGRTRGIPNKLGVPKKMRTNYEAMFRVDIKSTPHQNLQNWMNITNEVKAWIRCTPKDLKEITNKGSLQIINSKIDGKWDIVLQGIFDEHLMPESEAAVNAFIDFICTKFKGVNFVRQVLASLNQTEKAIGLHNENGRSLGTFTEYYLMVDGSTTLNRIPPEKLRYAGKKSRLFWIELLEKRHKAYLMVWERLLEKLTEVKNALSFGNKNVGLFKINKGHTNKELLEALFNAEESLKLFSPIGSSPSERVQAYRNLSILFGMSPRAYENYRSANNDK